MQYSDVLDDRWWRLILICLFAAWETFLICFNVEKSCAAYYFVENFLWIETSKECK